MRTAKRKVDVVVLSDVHLGTYGCHAKELLKYLRSIKPKTVVLNGDIIDIWQFTKSYFPNSHMKVLRHLMKWLTKGVKTYYIPGNHDELLRKFAGMKIGSFQIANKVVLELPNNEQAWVFHGDVFDVTMQHSKWLAKLGAKGYDALILLNRFVNFISERLLNKGRLSLSKKIKNSVKSAVKFINNFEQTSADIAISNGYNYVICGHIHQPEIRTITTKQGSTVYMNSGDWIENLSALECVDGKWRLFEFYEHQHTLFSTASEDDDEAELTASQLFDNMLQEFNLMRQ